MPLPATIGEGPVQVARLERSDGAALRRFFFRLSRESIYRRFLRPVVHPEQAHPERLLDVDHRDREALVGLIDGEIVGVARYARQPGSNEAELAVVVADAWQRRGIASLLLAALAEIALAAGIQAFTAVVHADNVPVLGLIRRMKPSARLVLADGLLEGTLPLPWDG